MRRHMAVSRRRFVACASMGVCLYSRDGALHAQGRRKMTREEAGYRESTDGASICAACADFVAPKYCSIMEGEVSPQGTCRYFRHVE
jgi:hypothetical protein